MQKGDYTTAHVQQLAPLGGAVIEGQKMLASPIKDHGIKMAGAPMSPVPEKMQELQMEAVQSLLGLSSVGPGASASGGGGRSVWANWEHSGRSRKDASLRKRLTAGDVAHSRLRVPGPLFELLFGRSAKVVLQAAPTNIGHFIAASAASERKGYLLQGEAVRQLFSDLNAELEDTIVLSHKGATADGTPIALCAIAKAEPEAREAAAAAAAARGAARARATRSAAGSPATPPEAAAAAAAACGTACSNLAMLLGGAGAGAGAGGSPASALTDFGLYYSSEEDEGTVGGLLLGPAGASGEAGADCAGPLGVDFDGAACAAAPCAGSVAEGGLSGGPGAAAVGGGLLLCTPPGAACGGAGASLGLLGSGGDAASAGGCKAHGGSGLSGRGGPLDADTAEAVAALAAAADDEVETGNAAEDSADPEWQARPKARGRPRKRRPAGAAGVLAGQKQRQSDGGSELVCAHCGTGDTPRWWKDNFPMGTLCNACGIWLKRHGYPRPVQFFVQPGGAAAPPRPKSAGRRDDGPSASSRLGEAPPDVEFYLINGRPKRRRTAQGSSAQAAPSSSNADAGVRLEAAHSELLEGGLQSPSQDPAINYEAAGGRVFVVRRKLVKGEDGQGTMAALVHFGWASSARAAHEMYDKVVRYGEASQAVTVDDYELLSDCKATATLQLRPGREAPPSWDALVRDFVDSL